MVRLATIINGFQPLTTVANLSILDICRIYWLSLLADFLFRQSMYFRQKSSYSV